MKVLAVPAGCNQCSCRACVQQWKHVHATSQRSAVKQNALQLDFLKVLYRNIDRLQCEYNSTHKFQEQKDAVCIGCQHYSFL